MPRLKAIVAHACAAEASFALAEMERLNIEALVTLKTRDNAQLRSFPRRPRRRGADDGERRAGRSRRQERRRAKVHDSYMAFRDKEQAWSRISLQAVLEARAG